MSGWPRLGRCAAICARRVTGSRDIQPAGFLRDRDSGFSSAPGNEAVVSRPVPRFGTGIRIRPARELTGWFSLMPAEQVRSRSAYPGPEELPHFCRRPGFGLAAAPAGRSCAPNCSNADPWPPAASLTRTEAPFFHKRCIFFKHRIDLSSSGIIVGKPGFSGDIAHVIQSLRRHDAERLVQRG